MVVSNDCKSDARVLNEAQVMTETLKSKTQILGLSTTTNAEFVADERYSILNLPRPWFYRLKSDYSRVLMSASSADAVKQTGLRLRIRKWCYKKLSLLKPLIVISCQLNFYFLALKKIRSYRPEVVHCHDLDTLIVGTFAKWLYNIPFIYDSHELWVDQTPNKKPGKIKEFLIRKFEGWQSQRASAVITVNDSIAEELSPMYNIKKPIVLRNCKRFKANSKMTVRDLITIPEGDLLFVYTGLATFGRGVEDFVAVLKEFPRIHLVIVGQCDSRFRSLLEETIEIKEKIHFIKPVPHDEVPSFICTADFAFVPAKNSCRSYYLALPNKFFEAVAARLPMVASDFPEFKKYFERYELGFTYSPDALGTLNEAVKKLISTKDNPQWQRNLDLAFNDLNWDTEKLKLVQFYRNCFPSLFNESHSKFNH